MLRYFPYLLGLLASFAAGFFLVSAALDEGSSGPRVTLTLDHDAAIPSSRHAKSPSRITEPTRQAARPDPHPQPAVRAPESAEPRSLPVARPVTRLVSFASAPFPYDGVIPGTDKPFLNIEEDGRQGHKTFSGRVYWEDKTYSDRRALLHIPKGFDTGKPAVMVLFFHGHGATLTRDVISRQRLPEQITQSGINAVLVAPQFAVNARDSSAGNFWKPGGVRRFLDEVAAKLAGLHGGPESARAFANMPVVIVGYSGGYHPTAWALAKGGVGERVKGVVLMDGLYGEVDKFATWIGQNRDGVFLSAYTGSTRKGNSKLKQVLAQQNIAYRTELDHRLSPGSVTIMAVDEEHKDYVTRAWTENPIADLLNRMTGTVRRARPALSASLAPSLNR